MYNSCSTLSIEGCFGEETFDSTVKTTTSMEGVSGRQNGLEVGPFRVGHLRVEPPQRSEDRDCVTIYGST